MRKIQDLTNKVFGFYKVLGYDKEKKKWKCECQCGTINYINTGNLNNGHSTSCGCKAWYFLINKTIGKLKVIDKDYKNSNGRTYMRCLCECGNISSTPLQSLKDKRTKNISCGKCFEYNVNSSFFDTIDTEEKAYVLGLLYADGYNNESKKTIKLDLIYTDEEILYKIKNILKFKGEIKQYDTKPSNFGSGKLYKGKPIARLLIHNTRLSDQLALKGCTNNKTYNLTFPNSDTLPREMYRHFIRGVIDGDGTISFSKNKVLVAITGTYELCNSIKVIFEGITNGTVTTSYHKNFNNNNNVTISIGGNRQTEKLLDWIYKNSSIYLERKYKKYLELKRINLIEPKPQSNKKEISQFDLDGRFIKNYNSIYEAGKLIKVNHRLISACLNGRSKTAGGYIWKYKGSYVSKSEIEYIKEIHKDTRIYQCDMSGNLLHIYKSEREVVRETGITNVGRVCKGIRKTAGGYNWRYAD